MKKHMKRDIKHLFSIIKCKKNPIKYFRNRGVRFGYNVKIYSPKPGLFSTEPWLVSIGNNVFIGIGVQFLTHDMGTLLFPEKDFVICGNINVGNNVCIGMGAMIMPGVNIGDNVIIGARSVVTKDVPNNCVVAGVPAKTIGSYENYSKKIDLVKQGKNSRYWSSLEEMHSLNPKNTHKKR